MRIGIVGNGVVGSATAQVYKNAGHDVRVYDSRAERSGHVKYEVLDCDLVFVCIPETGLDEFFCHLPVRYHHDTNFVIRSTCPVGTTRTLQNKYGIKNVCHSPEFLTARTAVLDASCPVQNVIGSTCYDRSSSIGSDRCASALYGLYVKRFPCSSIKCMTTDESEAVKLFVNGFFSVKVAFFNEINALVERLNLDWNTIVQAVIGDPRVGDTHTRVPGPDGKYGFGGACLPKDALTLLHCHDHAGTSYEVISAAIRRNNLIDRDRRVSNE